MDFVTSIKPNLTQILNFILPPRCVACGQRVDQSGNLCHTCWLDIPRQVGPACLVCDLPFGDLAQSAQGVQSQLICAGCLRSPPDFDWCLTATRYEGTARELVLKLKHSRQTSLGPVLGRIMGQKLIQAHARIGKAKLSREKIEEFSQQRRSLDFEVPISGVGSDGAVIQTGSSNTGENKSYKFIPIPLHPSRYARRRYNQARLLAEGLAKLTNGQVMASLLYRKKATITQAGLSRKGRKRNLDYAFGVYPSALKVVANSHLILVDDVFTTGATLESAARCLRQAGAMEIGAICFARAKGNRA